MPLPGWTFLKRLNLCWRWPWRTGWYYTGNQLDFSMKIIFFIIISLHLQWVKAPCVPADVSFNQVEAVISRRQKVKLQNYDKEAELINWQEQKELRSSSSDCSSQFKHSEIKMSLIRNLITFNLCITAVENNGVYVPTWTHFLIG